MADTTEKMSMSTAIGKAARFCQALLDDGVKPSELQRVIDDPALRRQVVMLLHGDPYDILPKYFDSARKFNTLCSLFRLRWIESDDFGVKLPQAHQHWEEPEEWQKPWFQHYGQDENFRELLKVLTPRQLQVVLWGWANPGAKQRDKAEHFGVSTGRIRDIETTSFQRLRAVLHRTIQAHNHAESRARLGVRGLKIEELEFSSRTRNCLRRVQIETVLQLIDLREEDLLNIVNFGQTQLKEVVAKLDVLGLCLKP